MIEHDWQRKEIRPRFLGDPIAWIVCTKCGEWKGLVETKCRNKTNAKDERVV